MVVGLSFNKSFDLGEEVLNRVEVRRVGRQIEKFGTVLFNEFGYLLAVMHGPVI